MIGQASVSEHEQPHRLTDNVIVRLAIVVSGLACFSLGIMLTLQSQVGLGPWDVFHQGVAKQLQLQFGTASILVGFFILLLAWVLGARPGIATVLNMLLVGGFINLYTAIGLVPDLGTLPLPVRIIIDLLGIWIVGLGTGLYLKGRLGAGPRDGLMLVLSRRAGGRVSIVRSAIELCALIVGYFLGGTAGLGTLLFALGVGPAVGMALRLFNVPVVPRK